MSLPKTPLMKEGRKEGKKRGFFLVISRTCCCCCLCTPPESLFWLVRSSVYQVTTHLCTLSSLPKTLLIIKKIKNYKKIILRLGLLTLEEEEEEQELLACFLMFIPSSIHPSIHPSFVVVAPLAPSIPHGVLVASGFTLVATSIPHGALVAIAFHSGCRIHPSSCVCGYWFTLMVTSIPHGALVAIAFQSGCRIHPSWCVRGYRFTLMVTSIPHGAFVGLLVYSCDHIHPSWCISDYWFTLVIPSIPHGALFIDGYWWLLLVHSSDHIHPSRHTNGWCWFITFLPTLSSSLLGGPKTPQKIRRGLTLG